MFGNKKLKEDQQRVMNIILKLLSHEQTVLENRFQKSHGRIAISLNDHRVEIIEEDHGVKFLVKYASSKISLTKKQYAKIMDEFASELKKRSGETKDFTYLDSLLNRTLAQPVESN